MDFSSKNNLKHYKKSMIDEYENTTTNDDDDDDDQIDHDGDKDNSNSSSNNKNKNVYCICKSSDTQRFMIGCDNCDDWFHGDCVGINESFTKNIKTFYCHICRFKNPQLTIKYKKKLTEKEIKEKYWKDINKREAREKELLKKMNLVSSDVTSEMQISKPISLKKEVNSGSVRTIETNLETKSSNEFVKTPISKEDIEQFVSALVQLGSDNTSPSLLNNRNLTLNNNLNLPFSISSSSAAPITVSTSNLTLATSQSPSSPSSTTSSTILSTKLAKSPQLKMLNEDNQGLKRQIKEEKLVSKDPSYCPSDEEDNDESINYEPKVKKQRGRKKKIQNPSDFESNNNVITTNKKTITKNKLQQPSSPKLDHNHKRHHHRRHHRHRSSRTSNTNNNQNSDDANDTDNIKQCLGPSCTEVARSGSKYCSDECGLKLAKKRLIYFLNEKSMANELVNEKTFSDELNEAQLIKIDEEIEISKFKLNEIEEEHSKLDSIIEKAKDKKINENIELDKDTEETEIYCVTCGHSCNEKHALKHMEKCFTKYESQAFFGSAYKSHPEGQSIFCDYYNAQTKMYCKRLRTMCPEHEKEKKVNEDEVCGCPLHNKNNVFEELNEICLASKRNCLLHFKWEKLRRAQIDLEKLRLWMKLDELYEQKRIIESAINNRNGFLSILLNKTIKNDI